MFSNSAATVDYTNFIPKLRCFLTHPPPSTTTIFVQSYDVSDLIRHRRLPRFWSKVTMFANSAATVDYRDFGPNLRCLRTRQSRPNTTTIKNRYDANEICVLCRNYRLPR